MLKKLILCSAAMASFQAHACTIYQNTAASVVSSVVAQHGWGFDNYDAICEKLNRANAALVTDGYATVLGNKSVAWATVSLKDRNLMIFTNAFGGLSTKTNDYASMDTAKDMLMESLNDAVNNMDIDKAIQSLNENRKQVKTAYSR